ncbi:diguanylate cyclase [Thermodesulfobacterium sp. TA1]|uniref:diguanylate cyclase n=1 Tax=Thermodesulfobacterium sp. TA1 TaxID=2234087 RepID=UPI0012328162|nr:diguanylate cyclase [Thermodesulfobacterium sp. TA1]QER41632.1 diguanylate cyclase [Thermodesulfobacterium sp. TA1]
MVFTELLACLIPRSALTITVNTTFQELIEKMNQTGETFVILLENHFPTGIFTERDLIRCLAAGVSLDEKVRMYAQKNLVKIREDRPLAIPLTIMIEYGIRRLIVVDQKGNYRGVITHKDIFEILDPDLFKKEITAGHFIKNKPFYYLSPDHTLQDALNLMVEKNIGAVPILEDTGKTVGILTEKDFIFNFELKNLSEKLRNIALKKVYTVSKNEPISYVKIKFKACGVNHLVVVDEEERAIGLLSTRDLLSMAKETYSSYIENKFKQAKDLLYILPEVVLEILDLGYDQVVYWGSAKAQELLGEQINEKSVYEVFDQEDWYRLFGKLKKLNKVHKEPIKTLKGQIFEASGSYLKLQVEGEGKIHLILRDITQNHRFLTDLQTQIEVIKTLINSIDSMILVVDPEDGTFRFYNQMVLSILGYNQEEINQKTIYDLVYLPYQQIKTNLNMVVKEGKEIKSERLYLTKNGDKIPVETYVFKITLDKPYVVISSKVKPIYQIENLNRELSLCKSKEEALSVLYKYLLDFIDTLQFIEINAETGEILSIEVQGDKVLWKGCVEGNINECKAYRTGTLIEHKETFCPILKNEQNIYFFCYPLILEGRVVGVFSLIRKSPFNDLEKENLKKMLTNFSFYFINLYLINKLKEISYTDYLTKVYNRMCVQEFLKKEFNLWKRKGGNLSIILLDLDDFKTINDRFGHFSGDLALQKIAKLLKENTREMDMVGRWGGEEFIIVLPQTSKAEAKKLAERLRLLIERMSIDLEGGTIINITASFGIASLPEDGTILEELYKIADQRLYQAKNLGKNRVIAD